MEFIHKVSSTCVKFKSRILQSLQLDEDKSYIVMSDGRTKLLDVLLSMSDCVRFDNFLSTLSDVDLCVDPFSPLWPGYSVLHLAILMTTDYKLLKLFKKFQSDGKIDFPFEEEATTAEDEFKYINRIENCLKIGCSVSIKDSNGITPVHLAFMMLNKVVASKLLLESKEVASDKDGLSFTHIACAIGDYDAFEHLLDLDADVEIATRSEFEWVNRCSLNSSEIKRKNLIVVPAKSTPLHIAVTFKNLWAVVTLLDCNVDLLVKNSLGLTPLHLSINCCIEDNLYREGLQITGFLLSEDENEIELMTDSGLSKLHVAACVNDVQYVTKLLESGAKIDSVFEITTKHLTHLGLLANATPLHVAVVSESVESAETLILYGSNFTKRTSTGETPLQYILRNTRLQNDLLLAYLKEKIHSQNVDVNEPIDVNGTTKLHVACLLHDFQWAIDLLRKGANANATVRYDKHDVETSWKGNTALHMLMYKLVDQILNETVNVALFIKFVKILIKYGANVLATNSAIESALLLLHRLFLDGPYVYPHDYVEVEGNILLWITKALLINQKTFRVNPTNKEGLSHFHYACIVNEVEIVQQYLDSGLVDVHESALVKITDQDTFTNFTPLHFAAHHENLDVLRLLIDRGANVNAVDSLGRTPLHIASKQLEFYGSFEMLLRNGSDMNATAYDGTTPFHLSLEGQSLTYEIFKFIMSHEPSTAVTNNTKEGIIGLVLLAAREDDADDIFNDCINYWDILNHEKKKWNPIENLVAVDQHDDLNVNFYSRFIKKLMDIGYSLDKQNEKGETALHAALKWNNLQAVEALLLLGADINITDNAGSPPISLLDSSERRNRTVKVLANHIWKLNHIGLTVHDKCLDVMYKIHEKSQLEEDVILQYTSELINLSDVYIGNFKNMMNFLSREGVLLYQTISAFQRENIDNFCKNTILLRDKFPQSTGLLRMQYRQAIDRMKLQLIAAKLIPLVLQVNIPHLCVETILKYLQDEEIRYFIRVHFHGRNIYVQHSKIDGIKRYLRLVT